MLDALDASAAPRTRNPGLRNHASLITPTDRRENRRAVAESWCSFALLGKVGPQSGGKEEVEYPVGQDARQVGEQCGVAADGVASARLARRHCLGDNLGRGVC